ncbi:MAG TPA: N-acetylglucosamine-6-phosphate deacetylase [Puia sp.]|nr:N-acetylglucosamine-6-phosphate deacetylase [Puia sp.]
MPSSIHIVNGRIITPDGIIPGNLLITGNSISRIHKDPISISGSLEIDAKGNYVSPGFIDLHVHGGGGADFMDGTVDAFLTAAGTHARHGTTSMLPTTTSSSREELLQILEVYKKAAPENKNGAGFLGLHLEGPYLSPHQRGAQDPRFLRDPDPEEYEDICNRSSDIRRWSAAPELPGALEFGRYLRRHNIIAALAHTDAVYEEARKGFENGYTLATHFYSCMTGVTRRNGHRYAGVVECAYLTDGMDVEIIADGVHLPEALLKLVYKIKGAERTALITDAMRAAGTDVKKSVLGSLSNGLDVIVEDGVAKLPDRSAFAGSVATADRLVRTMIRSAGVPLAEAVRMMSATPARILGIEGQKGILKEGMDADIIIFDEQISIQTTLVRGKIIFQRD